MKCQQTHGLIFNDVLCRQLDEEYLRKSSDNELYEQLDAKFHEHFDGPCDELHEQYDEELHTQSDEELHRQELHEICLKKPTTCFRSLINTLGVKDRPNGRHLNI